MNFKDQLNHYIDQLDCTAKELVEASGLSAASISRYRSGERIPEMNSKNYNDLVKGIVKIAKYKGIDTITIESVENNFSMIDVKKLQINLNLLINTLSINAVELSKFLNYDSSYISRIRNGKRQPARPYEFATKVANFIVHHYQKESEKKLIANLINHDIKDNEDYLNSLIHWLGNGVQNANNPLTDFLEKLDEFNLNEYIRVIHFDELKVPSIPFQFPTSKSYFGLKAMMESELSFLKATVLSKSLEPVIMYSDMPMEEMSKDPEFPKKWMFGMAMMLKKGLHLNQIHNLDRSFYEMMLGLESWIPMYMTGQISPYYLKKKQNHTFFHLLKVSGSVALTGEAINGYHKDGKYYLTKNKEEVSYYKKRANHLLSKASPLMEIYRQDKQFSYHSFLQNNAKEIGQRHTILSSLPLYTATNELIVKILNANNITNQTKILEYISSKRNQIEEILQHSKIIEEIPFFTKEEFNHFPMALSLSELFFEKDILYTWDDYCKHITQTYEYAKLHSNYQVKENTQFAFRNIQITIHEGNCVMVSKNKAPAIHFLIRHPKMQEAFENIIIPFT